MLIPSASGRPTRPSTWTFQFGSAAGSRLCTPTARLSPTRTSVPPAPDDGVGAGVGAGAGVAGAAGLAGGCVVVAPPASDSGFFRRARGRAGALTAWTANVSVAAVAAAGETA